MRFIYKNLYLFIIQIVVKKYKMSTSVSQSTQPNKYEVNFTKNLQQFVEEVRACFTKITSKQLSNLQKELSIDTFYKVMTPHLESILNYSYQIQSDTSPLSSFSISLLLENPLYRETVHNYLYTLYFSSYQFNNQQNTITTEEKEVYTRIIDLYYQSKKQQLQQQSTAQSTAQSSTTSDSDVPSVFGNGIIGNIAKDVMKDIDLSQISDANPMDLLGMFTGNGSNSNLQNMFSTITNKITNTLQNGSIDQSQLLKEATSMMGQLGMAGGEDGQATSGSPFGQMGQMANLFQSMASSMGGGESSDTIPPLSKKKLKKLKKLTKQKKK